MNSTLSVMRVRSSCGRTIVFKPFRSKASAVGPPGPRNRVSVPSLQARRRVPPRFGLQGGVVAGLEQCTHVHLVECRLALNAEIGRDRYVVVADLVSLGDGVDPERSPMPSDLISVSIERPATLMSFGFTTAYSGSILLLRMM